VRLPVFALALGAFTIGTTEFVTMGLLPEIAATFAVPIPTAGWLVTGYALGVVVGAPLLTAAAHRYPRRQVLIGLMLLFALGHVLTVLAPPSGCWSPPACSAPSPTARTSARAPWSPGSSRRPVARVRRWPW
jgi:DHA1 family inner membrane transport protein